MKISFVIGCVNSKSNGNGGHYHSLVTMCKMLSKNHDVFVINVGTTKSNTLVKENIKVYNVISEKLNYLKNKNNIKSILNKEKPEILNAFDDIAYFWVRILGKELSIPYTLTKCGGQNPKKYFPYCKDLFLYSNENLKYFKAKNKFKGINTYLIPNRVFAFEPSKQRLNLLSEKYPIIKENSIKLLRICRIGNMFKKSIIQLINLNERLLLDGCNSLVVIIGVVEDQLVLEELKEKAIGKNVLFVNDSIFYKNAKELIGFTDFVVGTGRSFMEAASQSKVMLSPIHNGKYPLIITEDNFDNVMNYNFSERFVLENYNEEENYRKIKKTVLSEKEIEKYKLFSKEIFTKKFNVETVLDKYIKIYQGITLHSEKYSDLILHLLYMIRKYKYKI